MSNASDPAILRAQELWKQHRDKDALLMLVERINELNAAQPKRYTKGKRPLLAGILVGMFLTVMILALVLAGSPNLRWLSNADLTQLEPNGVQIVITPTPDLAATREILSERSTAIARTNAALAAQYNATLMALAQSERATQTSIAHSSGTATASAIVTPGP
jgi:hypothetical protein